MKSQIRELKEQLVASEQMTERLQQNLQQKEKTILKLQEKNQQFHASQQKKLTLIWKTCNAAQCKMSRGSAIVCGRMAYFGPDRSSQVHSYDSHTEEWSTLPECPTYNFTLTVVNGHVTAVGGRYNTLIPSYKLTNTLHSLIEDSGERKWVDHFPHMPTKRELTAAVCSGKALVVAGGQGEWWTKLTTVEVMDTDTLMWSTVSSLPHPLYDASAAVCQGTVYLVGGFCYSKKSVFTYSLAENHPAWRLSTDLPVTDSTCFTLNGQLVAVGGQDSDGKYSNNIYSINTEANSWEIISQIPTPRRWCLVTVLPGNKLMVVGGETYTGDTREVDIATVQ